MGCFIFHTISIKNLEGTFKLKALPAISLLVLEGLLLGGEGLAHLDVSQFDCPFLILHTFIMKNFEGNGNRKSATPFGVALGFPS